MALNHRVTGSHTYTIVGTPTLVEGVVSDFAASSYIKTESFSSNTAIDKHIEIQFKLKTPSDMTGYQYLISQLVSGGVFGGTNLFLNTGYLGSLASMDGSNWSSATTNYQLSADTTYDLKYNYNKDTYQEKFSIKQGNTWTEVATITRNSAIYGSSLNLCFGSGVTFHNPFRGTIDLNETYIKINGQAWFGVCPVEVKHIDYGTSVGYTKVGSPTVSNGVARGFSASNYLQAQQLPTDFWTNDFEICAAVHTPTTWPSGDAYLLKGARRRVGDTNSDTGILIWWSNNKLAMTGSYRNISGSSPFGVEITPQLNTKYWMKIVQVGHTISGYYSLNGSDWTLLDTADDYGYAGTPNTLATLLGQDNDCAGFSIDLNETYIKANGKLWFFRPSTNYLVKDDKLVFADSGLYIDDNGTKTYATANLAPVPSGFVYGNTTTTAIGWVDMRTQAFTAAPSGATLGKD